MITEHAICLGCGLACDDIGVDVQGGRITAARNACSLGTQWYGDGQLPAKTTVRGTDADVRAAIGEAAKLLRGAEQPLVYLAPELSGAAQRDATAVADVLRAALDSVTSSTAANGIIAAQERGRVTATFGELRHRADVVVFWGLDPSADYPRLFARYLPTPRPTVIAVDIGADRGPADADLRVAFAPEDETTAIALIRAAVAGTAIPASDPGSAAGRAAALAPRLTGAKYLGIFVDGESRPGRDVARSDALIALSQSLNGPTRCAMLSLRAGGNRLSAEAVMTWQTGYPMAVDFARGTPRYDPSDRAAARLTRGAVDVALIVGSPAGVPTDVRAGLAGVTCIVIGPGASASPFAAAVAIDTGKAGIHEAGSAVRVDDIPFTLRAPLDGTARSAAETVRSLLTELVGR
jgi:formylmethanofuran dehydrogenase subunit B